MYLLRKVFSNKRTSEDITLEDMENMLKTKSETILLDVRSPQEFKEGHMLGAINIPLYEIWQTIKYKIPNKNAIIIAYCKNGIRSKKAVKLLKKSGYTNSYNLITN